MARSKIGWVGGGYTFNIAWGCTKISPGCDYCYAETLAKRTGWDVWGDDKPRRLFGADHWAKPLDWDKKAAAGGPKLVFSSSMADVFENHPDYPVLRERLFKLIRTTPNLIWLLLTKRPGNIAKMLPPDWGAGYPNVMLMATVTGQPEANRDLRKLLETPARWRGISYEPALLPLDLRSIEVERKNGMTLSLDALTGCWTSGMKVRGDIVAAATALNDLMPLPAKLPPLDWVIAGGESGPRTRARGPYADWFISLEQQCLFPGTPFYFKQWGTWAPVPRDESLPGSPRMVREGDMMVSPGGMRYILGPDLSSPLEGISIPLRAAPPGAPHQPLLGGQTHFDWPKEWRIEA